MLLVEFFRSLTKIERSSRSDKSGNLVNLSTVQQLTILARHCTARVVSLISTVPGDRS